MNKRFAIIFTDEWLAYSPTILNLFGLLRSHCFVKIIALRPKKFPVITLDGLEYVDALSISSSRFIAKANKLFKRKNGLIEDDQLYIEPIRKQLLKYNINHLIAVDFRSLALAQRLFRKDIHFLSLELQENKWSSLCDLNKVKSIMIQSRDRFEFLGISNTRIPVFIVPNSPIYNDGNISLTRQSGVILHAGTAQPGFGVYPILNFAVKTQYSVYFKGFMPDEVKHEINKLYLDELVNNKIVVDEEYLAEDEVVRFMSSFRIGFCFYDLSYPWVNTFNYLTAPSGKLYKYLAAGIPVVGSNIPGLKILEDTRSGILLNNLSSDSIRQAVEEIDANYDQYSKNARDTARSLSFDKMSADYIEFLLG